MGNDLGARAGKVESVGLFGAAKVVEFEDKVFGEVGLVTPDDPANASVDKAKFMAGCIY